VRYDDYVWYASYGSNLCKDRFLCYIRGGTPHGSTQEERGCGDQRLPLEDYRIVIPHELYFAGHADRWNGGPAFISLTSSGSLRLLTSEVTVPTLQPHETLGRMYKVTAGQFIEVVQQENNEEIEFNLSELSEINQLGGKRYPELRYGSILKLGEYRDMPIFTFTSTLQMGDEPFTAPSDAYLRMLMSGIKEAYSFDAEHQSEYFVQKRGIHGRLSKEYLKDLVNSLT
jgi:hypothetical protein